MEWIRLTSEDLEYALNKPQLETLKAESLRNLKRDIAQDVLNTVVARIRAEISASGLNCLDADHSRIPYELRDCALRLAVEALHLRVPSIEISALQSKHADLARETLLRIATGQLPVSRPTAAVRTASAKRSVYSKSAPRKATRSTTEGL